MAHHFVKPDVVRSVEVSQLLDGVSVYLHVSPALGFAQATRRGAAFRLLQAREAFGAVEIEVLVRDDALQTQEVLHPRQLPCRVGDKTLPAHKVDLSQGEVAQPGFQVQNVESDPNGVPGHVHDSQALVFEGQLLETGQVRGFR